MKSQIYKASNLRYQYQELTEILYQLTIQRNPCYTNSSDTIEIKKRKMQNNNN